MGYTHYWTPKKATKKNWNKLLEEVKQLHQSLPKSITINGGLGEGEPEFSEKMIWFNGDRENDLDHETFLIEPDKDEWNFCKTAHKPYDLLVCATLIAAKNILGYEVNSDGNLIGWKPAIEFYIKTIYDFEDTEPEDKISILKSILPAFIVEEWSKTGKLELDL